MINPLSDLDFTIIILIVGYMSSLMTFLSTLDKPGNKKSTITNESDQLKNTRKSA